MIEIGRRRCNQPAPPRYVFDALTDPTRDPTRPWLNLQIGEIRPTVLRSEFPSSILWSSLWSDRRDAQIELALRPGANGQGTDLEWRLFVEEPVPDASKTGQLRKRINELINRDLRYTFGQ